MSTCDGEVLRTCTRCGHLKENHNSLTGNCGICTCGALGTPGYTEEVPERYGRDGDSQPMPLRNDGTDIQSLVIIDINARRNLGIKRYGTALQAHNGRNALQDAYEECLDLCMYLKQKLVEETNG